MSSSGRIKKRFQELLLCPYPSVNSKTNKFKNFERCPQWKWSDGIKSLASFYSIYKAALLGALWVKTSRIYLVHDLSTISMANIASLVSIRCAHTTLLNVTRNSNSLNLRFLGPPKGWGNSSSLQKTYNGIEMLPNGRGSSEEWKVQLNLKLQSPEIRNSIGWSIVFFFISIIYTTLSNLLHSRKNIES